MDNSDITRYIVAELRKYRAPNDIIEVVCERSGMKWADAQQFVERVQSEHAAEIMGGQNAVLVAIGAAMAIAGLALSVVSLAFTARGSGDWCLIFVLVGLPMMIGGVIGLLNGRSKRGD